MVSTLHGAPRRSLPALAVMALMTASWLSASAPAQAQATFEKIKNRGKISIGYREDAAPFSYHDDQKKAIGYSIDFCAAVVAQLATKLQLTNLNINMVPIPIDQVMTYVKDGTIDLLCTGTTDTPERRMQASFSKPIYFDGVGIMVRKKDGISTVKQLNGKQITTIKASTSGRVLDAYSAKEVLSWKVEPALNADAAFSQLQLGWVQGYARDKVLLATQLANISDMDQYEILPERLSTEPIAIAFRKDDADMQTLVDGVIAEAGASGKATQLHDKWFVSPIPIRNQRKALNIPMSAELKASFNSK
jgi:glutamate/aspartate transport system substrate-binding protein